MSKHTPGPWVIDGYGSVNGPDGRQIVASGIAHTLGYTPPESPYHANARLIAAAPDLLEALESIASEPHDADSNGWLRVDLPPSTIQMALAAIKKARGA